MTKPIASTDDQARPEDSPIAWFGEMLLAIEREDYRRAAEASRQLARLGWSLVHRKVNRQATGRGGA